MDNNYTTMGKRAVKTVVGGVALAGIGAAVTPFVLGHLAYEAFRGTEADNMPGRTNPRQGSLMDRLAKMYQGHEQ